MEGLKVVVLNGEHAGQVGKVYSPAFMGDDNKFYVVVLIGGWFPTIATSSLMVSKGEAESVSQAELAAAMGAE